MKKLCLFLLGLAITGCTAYSSGSANNAPYSPTYLSGESVEALSQIPVKGVGLVPLEKYTCIVLVSEFPIATWYAQTADRPDLRAGLRSYVSVASIAVRSFAFHRLRRKSELAPDETDQAYKPYKWFNECSSDLQNFIRSAVASTDDWYLVDLFSDAEAKNYPAEASYARTTQEPSPSGRYGARQGSHFTSAVSVVIPEEPGNHASMGMSQLGLGQFVFGYRAGSDGGVTLSFDDHLPAGPHLNLEIQDYLALFYPHYAVNIHGQVELLQGRWQRLAGYPEIRKYSEANYSFEKALGIEVADRQERPGYLLFQPELGRNVVYYHELVDGNIFPGFGPEAGFYCRPQVGGTHVLTLRAQEEGVKLRAYLYERGNQRALAATGASQGNTATSVLVNLTSGQDHILVVDVESWEPGKAESRGHGGAMPPFRVSLTRK